jgi:WD40 repeat protein
VNAIAITSDGKGKRVISASEDKTIKIWDLETGKEKFILKGHSSVIAIALTPDGKTMISGSRDNTIQIWDLKTGKEKFTLTDHSDLLNSFHSYLVPITLTPESRGVIIKGII